MLPLRPSPSVQSASLSSTETSPPNRQDLLFPTKKGNKTNNIFLKKIQTGQRDLERGGYAGREHCGHRRLPPGLQGIRAVAGAERGAGAIAARAALHKQADVLVSQKGGKLKVASFF